MMSAPAEVGADAPASQVGAALPDAARRPDPRGDVLPLRAAAYRRGPRVQRVTGAGLSQRVPPPAPHAAVTLRCAAGVLRHRHVDPVGVAADRRGRCLHEASAVPYLAEVVEPE